MLNVSQWSNLNDALQFAAKSAKTWRMLGLL